MTTVDTANIALNNNCFQAGEPCILLPHRLHCQFEFVPALSPILIAAEFDISHIIEF
jgi:hypothetical protein